MIRHPPAPSIRTYLEHGLASTGRQSDGTTLTLPHAHFFGSSERKASVAGFALADMRTDPHLTVQRHTHDTAHLVFSMSGAYITTARGAPEVSVRPILVYNPPGTTHRDRFAESAGRCDGSFLSLAVAADRMRGVGEEVPLIEEPVCLDDARALALAIRLVRECRSWDAGSPLVVEAVALELVGAGARRPLPESGGAPGWLCRARDMLRELAASEVSVDLVARECGVHPVHLARSFRRFFRSSPGHYWRRCRAERAAVLLRDSRWSLSRVALESGFADQSHLTHTFRRLYALTPAEYRRHLGGAVGPARKSGFKSTRPAGPAAA
jgi:AraC family transcriptional regulator